MSTYNNQTGMLPPQFLLKQRYVVLGQAGRGGMGAVYRATDTLRGRRVVAIKELSQSHLGGEELTAAADRFLQEARMLGALAHPNLPRILDAFREQERFYLVMDFIEGQTLQQLLREKRGEPLSVQQGLSYAMQLCDVLSYLHQQKPPIIFRDMKPSNVMITPDQHVFLIDFGIARFFKEGQAQDTILLGSPGYAPPEQHGLAQTSPQSDIYSLGALLHYCLCGQDPYYARERFVFAPLQTLNPQVPAELNQLIQSMVAYDPRQRPATAQEVQQRLAHIKQQATDHTTAMTPVASSAQAPTQYVQPLPTTPPIIPTQQAMAPVAIPPTVAVSKPGTPSTQPARPGLSKTPTSRPPFWSRSFMLLFVLSLIVTVGSSVALLRMIPPLAYGLIFVLESGLALLFILVASIGSVMISNFLQKAALLVASVVALVAGGVTLILAFPDLYALVQQLFLPQTLVQVLSYSVVTVALVSLLWLLRPFSWLERGILLIVFVGAGVCALALTPSATGTQGHILLLLAFIVLIQGTLVAIQMERSYHS